MGNLGEFTKAGCSVALGIHEDRLLGNVKKLNILYKNNFIRTRA